MPTALSDLPMTADSTRRFAEDGYVVVRGVFEPSEIARVAADAERLVERKDLIDTRNLRCRWQIRCTDGECLFETFDPVIDLSPACREVALHPQLLAILEQLYGEPAKLFKDKLIFKPPGATGYDLHQDFIAWPNFPRSFLTAAMAIDPCSLENGCTIAYSGYHLNGSLSPEDSEYHPLPRETVDEAKAVPLELEPGDVAFFGCFTPHRSEPNRSSSWRRLLYASYNAASDGDLRDTHYAEFIPWLRKKYAEYGKSNTYFA